ncbi:MAG: 2-C-methyl-D-erythritol 4-phosphate cytidylyltransferase [Betaproteobacteria bacterium]|nr:2-C-methyl-D-erythritol 4-phosphate cytidylyltransferase [Betaproteobacteria bacterium]
MRSYFALVPAAGSGFRMGETGAKQYLPVRGRPLIYHALRTLCGLSTIRQVFVVLAAEDAAWHEHDWSAFSGKLCPLFCGGKTRAESVLNGLRASRSAIGDDDWVLVHDAARPCVSSVLVDQLMRELAGDEVGGLLAVPVADTLKRDDGQGRVLRTEPRARLWQAQTPQMFRYGTLVTALKQAGTEATDEASAVEALGLKPRLVLGDIRNLKVTYPQDLGLAELILQDREAP